MSLFWDGVIHPAAGVDVWPLMEGAPPTTSLTITVPGAMRGKGRVRFRQRGKFLQPFVDEKTVNAETWIRCNAIQQIGSPRLTGALGLRMVIDVEIPASWSVRKRARALLGEIRPTGRPDLDNNGKLVCDALNGIAWVDDAQLADLHITRRYGPIPQTVLTVRSL